MASDLDLKDIAEQIAQFSQDGHTDYEIDQGLAEVYPELVTKNAYDKHGKYIDGSAYREFLLEVAREKAPRGTTKYFANLAHNWLDTATFGQGKKVAALLGSVIHDKSYDYVLDTLTQEEQRFDELRPTDSMTARMAGGISPLPIAATGVGFNLLNKTPFLGKLLRPKTGQTVGNIAKETAKSVPVSMGESVLYTAGTSRDMEEFKQRVGPEAIATGIGSAALTPTIMGAGKGLGAGARFVKGKMSGDQGLPPGVTRTDDDRALEVMSKAREAGYSDAEILAEIERIRKIDPDLADRLTQMDVAGDPFVGTTMGAMGTSGAAQATGVKNIAPFFREQVERLQKFSAKTLLKSDSVAEFRAKRKAARIKAGKAYDKLWLKGKGKKKQRVEVAVNARTKVKFDEGDETVSLQQILDPNKPSVKAAMAEAQKLANEARVILPTPGTGKFDAEHLHFIKMGYDQILTKYGDEGLSGVMRMEATKNLKRLTKLMDDKVPDYQKARNAYAVPTAENRAFTEGYNAMKNSIDPEKIPEMMEVKFKDFSGHEKEAYKAGAANFMDQFIEQGMDPLSVTNKARKLSQISLIKKVRAIWGDKVADQYKNYMEEHAKMLQKRADVSPRAGSLTFARGEAADQFKFDDLGPGQAVPLSTNEAVRAGLNTQPNAQAAQEMSRGAAEAASQRLTLPGPDQITTNLSDMAAWEKLQRMKQRAEAARRGAVPGLISPYAGELSNQFGPQ